MFQPDMNITPIIEVNDILLMCKGNQKSKFLVILDESEDKKENAELQIKIFNAIGYSYPNDFLVLKITNTTYFKLIDLIDSTQIDFVMTFGVPLSQLSLQYDLKNYESIKVGNATLIKSISLHNLQESKADKAALWGGIKKVFSKK